NDRRRHVLRDVLNLLPWPGRRFVRDRCCLRYPYRLAKSGKLLRSEVALAPSLLVGSDAPCRIAAFRDMAGVISRLVDRSNEFEAAVRCGRTGLPDPRVQPLDLFARNSVKLARADSRTNMPLQQRTIVPDGPW